MIAHFPVLLPEELVYSGCARFASRHQYCSMLVKGELFGTRNIAGAVDFPARLGTLAARLPPGHNHTADSLIDRHTLLPFYTPFLPLGTVEVLRESMAGNRGQTLHSRVGNHTPESYASAWLRFCPECHRQSAAQSGEVFWHRVHQIAGVHVCPIHQVFLENSTAGRGRTTRYQGFVPASYDMACVSLPLDTSQPEHGHLLQFARDAAWLLRQTGLVPGPELLRSRYISLMVERGLATCKGRIRWAAFRSELLTYYSRGYLTLLRCDLEQPAEWLSGALHPPTLSRVRSAIRHLLLIRFLGHSAESFFSSLHDLSPFGPGPWPCLNPVCSLHNHPSITECNTEHNSIRRAPMGIFTCPDCGYSYSQYAFDHSGKRMRRNGWVRDRGPLWRERFAQWWKDSDLSLSDIARRLGTQPVVVKRMAIKAGWTFPRVAKWVISIRPIHGPAKKPKLLDVPRRGFVQERERRRDRWLALLKEYPEHSTNQFIEVTPNAYNWLYRNDKQWLFDHRPAKRPAFARPSVDWRARDLRWASLVTTTANELLSLPGRPRQLTPNEIARHIGAEYAYIFRKEKVPLTMQALTSAAGSRLQLALRRLSWALDTFRAEGVCPHRWQLVARALIRHDQVLFEEVRVSLDRAVEGLRLEYSEKVPPITGAIRQNREQ